MVGCIALHRHSLTSSLKMAGRTKCGWFSVTQRRIAVLYLPFLHVNTVVNINCQNWTDLAGESYHLEFNPRHALSVAFENTAQVYSEYDRVLHTPRMSWDYSASSLIQPRLSKSSLSQTPYIIIVSCCALMENNLLCIQIVLCHLHKHFIYPNTSLHKGVWIGEDALYYLL